MKNKSEKTTDDTILNGRIFLRQPKEGYRVAIDPIILASFVYPKDNQKILDVGCGVGAISLILKYRNNSLKITSIDIDEIMYELCRYNSHKNSLELDVRNTDLKNMSNKELYDHVVTNPPFFTAQSSRISEKKRLANFETLELSKWISCCLDKLKNKGKFSIIHSASRIDDILCALHGKAGDITITPIFPKPNEHAIRIVIQCIKGNKSEPKITNGLIIHNENGKFSKDIQQILDGKIYSEL